MRRSAWLAILSLSIAGPAIAQAPPAADSQDTQEAITRLLETSQTLAELAEQMARRAQATFIPECAAVAGSEAYCQCVLDKLPIRYAGSDDPWLLFVVSIKQRKFVGDLTDEDDTDETRFDLYFAARRAVQECASTGPGRDVP